MPQRPQDDQHGTPPAPTGVDDLVTPTRRCLLLVVTFAALSCGSESEPTAPELESGSLEASVSATGEDTPAGFTLTLDDADARPVDAGGSVVFSPIDAGSHTVALGGVPANCAVSGANPRVVNVAAGQAAMAAFSVDCGAAAGGIDVVAVTTGSSLDPDGYAVTVELAGGVPSGAPPADPVPIGANGNATVAPVPVGEHRVALSGVAPNCGVQGPDPVAVTVTAQATAAVRFDVLCAEGAGALELSVETSGVDLDPDGYVALMGQDLTYAVGEVRLIGGLAAGSHSVELTGVAANCSVRDPNPALAVVAADETTPLTMQVECGQSSNARPVVSISSPDTSRTAVPLTVEPGVEVALAGGALDDEEGELPGASLDWSSNLDGRLGTGRTISTGSLSEGLHTITLSATDREGAVGSESVLVVVVSPSRPGFQIKLRVAEGLSLAPSERDAIETALAKLTGAIVGDLPDVPLRTSGFSCAAAVPAVDETVDDLLLYLGVAQIDGRGGVIGAATSCIEREGSRMPVLGGMLFDAADLPGLTAAGVLDELALHEATHVLGFGSAWRSRGLLKDPSDPARGGTPGNDTYFDGPEAQAQFGAVGGDAYTGGNIVPVENDGERFSSGSLDGHWRESVLHNEIMTPALNPAAPTNPLSSVTIGHFRDFGYEVDLAAAEPYELILEPPGDDPQWLAPEVPTIRLRDDVVEGPLWTVRPDGELRRVR